jgi:hypothetical protein
MITGLRVSAAKKTYGVLGLPVQSVRGLALEVVPDDINHAKREGDTTQSR